LYPDAAVSSYKGRGGVYLLYMSANETLIHPTALVDPGARIGKNVRIGPFTIIHRNVELGDNTVVGSHCELGHPSHDPAYSGPLVIGANSLIRSYSMFYEGSTFGEGLITGNRVTVRENTRAGYNLQLGTLCDVQGHCTIGNYVRVYNNSHICRHAIVHDFVWIFAYVLLTNDPQPPSNTEIGPVLNRYCVIASMSIILPGVVIGEDSLIGAGSTVTKNIEPKSVALGSPARRVCLISDLKLRGDHDLSAYPWRYRFHRGYPEEVVWSWIQEAEKFAARRG